MSAIKNYNFVMLYHNNTNFVELSDSTLQYINGLNPYNVSGVDLDIITNPNYDEYDNINNFITLKDIVDVADAANVSLADQLTNADLSWEVGNEFINQPLHDIQLVYVYKNRHHVIIYFTIYESLTEDEEYSKSYGVSTITDISLFDSSLPNNKNILVMLNFNLVTPTDINASIPHDKLPELFNDYVSPLPGNEITDVNVRLDPVSNTVMYTPVDFTFSEDLFDNKLGVWEVIIEYLNENTRITTV